MMKHSSIKEHKQSQVSNVFSRRNRTISEHPILKRVEFFMWRGSRTTRSVGKTLKNISEVGQAALGAKVPNCTVSMGI